MIKLRTLAGHISTNKLTEGTITVADIEYVTSPVNNKYGLGFAFNPSNSEYLDKANAIGKEEQIKGIMEEIKKYMPNFAECLYPIDNVPGYIVLQINGKKLLDILSKKIK
jgi:hypothetical protein